MKLNYNATGAERKSLVAAISQTLNAPTKYLGAPTFAYEVRSYHIDKNGLLTGKDNLDLEDTLHQLGFDAVGREYDEPDTYESGLGGLGAVPAFEDLHLTRNEEFGLGKERHDPIGEDGMQASDVPGADEDDTLAIEIPKKGMTDTQVQNLLKLVQSRHTLLTKALGAPLKINDCGETLQFVFPYEQDNGCADFEGVGIMYSHLAAALVKYVKKHQRVTATEKEIESEKFSLRTFLVKIGMNGAEYKATRGFLLRRLSGNSSFAQNASYTAMQENRKGGKSDERN